MQWTQALARFEGLMRAQMRSEGIPGLSVAILRDQALTYARGFGYAEVEMGTAASATTAYSIASLSKPLSAVVILRLVELGRLDLERPMASFAGYAEFCARLRESGLISGRISTARRPRRYGIC
jgi:CubicO group peptidase (beta-lactamase class C family)